MGQTKQKQAIGMKIKIIRYQIKGECCDAHLYIDNRYVCDCAENACHRVPQGPYEVELCYHAAVQRKVPMLFPKGAVALAWESPYPVITMGNGVHALRNGEIIVGTRLVPGVVIRSREAFQPLYDCVNMSKRRGNKVTVQIIESITDKL